jgi:hypothetical protein
MNQEQLDILNEIRVKMFYDPRKTLSEQSVVGAPDGGVIGTRELTKKPTEPENPIEKAFENVEIFPIPGHTTYMIPKINDPNGGLAYYYFPIETSKIQKFTFPVCEDFKNGEEFCKRYSINQPQLAKVLPVGSIREFRIGDDYYVARIGYNLTKNQLVFAGYKNQDGDLYISPDPEDFKSEWEKFLDDFGTLFQVIGSILVVIIIEYFSVGLATPLAYRIAIEIFAELLVNIPVALYDFKKGNTASGGLSLLFSLLPLMNNFLKIKGLTKEIAENIAEKLAQSEIKNVEQLGKFYETLTDPEKYVFSQVMKFDPKVLTSVIGKELKNILQDAIQNNTVILEKLLLKDQNWWKSIGLQLSAALPVAIAKEIFTKDFTEQEIQRMVEFFTDLEKQIGFDKTRAILRESLKNPNYGKQAFEQIIKSTPEEREKITLQMISDIETIIPRRDTGTSSGNKIIQASDTTKTQ